MSRRSPSRQFPRTVFGVFLDVLAFFCLTLQSSSALAAENLFLRKQLGLYVERQKKPRRATDSVRFTLAQLSRLFDGSSVLTVVKPDTLILWHRKGFPLLEVEVSVERTTASSDRCAGVNCRHGIEQSDLG